MSTEETKLKDIWDDSNHDSNDDLNDVNINTSKDDMIYYNNDDNLDEDSDLNDIKESNYLAYQSDSTVESDGDLIRTGNVPREWYDNELHDGYDIDGNKVYSRGFGDHIDQFLRTRNKDELMYVQIYMFLYYFVIIYDGNVSIFLLIYFLGEQYMIIKMIKQRV